MPLRTTCFQDTVSGRAAKRCTRLPVHVLATKLAEGRQHPQHQNLFSLSLPSFMLFVYVSPYQKKKKNTGLVCTRCQFGLVILRELISDLKVRRGLGNWSLSQRQVGSCFHPIVSTNFKFQSLENGEDLLTCVHDYCERAFFHPETDETGEELYFYLLFTPYFSLHLFSESHLVKCQRNNTETAKLLLTTRCFLTGNRYCDKDNKLVLSQHICGRD